MTTEPSHPPDDPGTIFYIGQHETLQIEPVTVNQLSQLQALGYDFLTTQITTSAFHSRVISQLKDYQRAIAQHSDPVSVTWPSLPSLTPADTTLEPGNSNSYLIGIVSPWIDLGSHDPIIAHISRQVLNVEVAYAAFCGINNLLVYGPSSARQNIQFARDVREALGLGPYLHLYILLPMTGELESDHGDLTHLSEMINEPDFDQEDEIPNNTDLYSSWDTWNTIRTMCSYSQKLSIGMHPIVVSHFIATSLSLSARGGCSLP